MSGVLLPSSEYQVKIIAYKYSRNGDFGVSTQSGILN